MQPLRGKNRFHPRIGWPLLRLQWSFFLLTLETRSSQLAIAWWTLTATGSISQFSVMTGTAMTAEILAKPLLGWMGDRYSKIRIIRYGNLVAFLAALMTLWLSTIGTFHTVLLSIAMGVSGVVMGLRDPIQSSIIPELAPKTAVERAFQSKTMLWSVALVLGPAFAGLLLSFGTIAVPFIVNVCLVLGAIALTLPAKDVKIFIAEDGVTQAHNRLTPLRLITSGFSIVSHVKMERYLALFSMTINFVLAPFFVLIVPFYVKEIVSLPAWYAGLLDACFGLGILLGSRSLPGFLKPYAHRDFLIKAGFFFLGINLLALGVGVHIWSLPIFFVLGGIGLVWININTAVVRSIATPVAYRNRMIATVSFVSQCASPLGNLVVGETIAHWGVYSITTIIGTAILLLVIFLNYVPQIRLFMRMKDDELLDAYARAYPAAFER